MFRIIILFLLTTSSVEVHLPRTFGYLTGDLVTLEVRVRVPSGAVLVEESLFQIQTPDWLELRSVRWKRRGREYRIRLVYQVFYAPPQVTVVEIPSWTLRFRLDSQWTEVTVPPVPITLSPLTDLSAQPEPDLLPSSPSSRILYVHATLLALLIGTTAVLWGFRRARRPRIFLKAHRAIRSLDDPAQAFHTLWEALEQKAEAPLFPHTLETLLRRWPSAEELREELTWFFELREAWLYRT